jgi:hypothetical protein
MRPIRVLLYCTIFLAFCTDHEELTKRSYPLVTTFEVTSITRSGAKFRGEISGVENDEVLEHGFLWNSYPTLTLETSDKTTLGEIENDGVFTSQISTTLNEGETYYVRAYVKTSRHTVYGNAVSFLSLGSKAPVIKDFTPKKGFAQDTIEIRGRGFSYLKNKNIVKFHEATAKIISESDTLLRVSVPDSLAQVKSKISVSIIGNVATSTEEFELIVAEVISVTPSIVKACDTLIITGKNFPLNTAALKVILENTACKVIQHSSTEIRAVVPVFSPPTSTVEGSVISSNIKSSFPEKITYKKPQFLGLKARTNTTFNDTLIINAKNLPLCHTLKLTLGAVVQPVITSNDSIISFRVPESLTTSENILTVTFNDTDFVFNSLVKLSPPKITSVTPTSGTFTDVVTITGKNFHPQKERNLISLLGATGYAITAQSTKITIAVPIEAQVCDFCSNIYIQVNDQGTESNPDIFTLKAPVLTSVSPAVISQPGPVTLTGDYFNPQAEYNEVYIDNPASVLSAIRTQIVANVNLNTLANGDPYLSSLKTGRVEVEVGNLVTNQLSIVMDYKGPWTQKADLPGTARLYPVSFTLQDKLYVGLGQAKNGGLLLDFWEYNPSTDTWTQRANFPGNGRVEATSFVMNGKAHVGLGKTETFAQLKDFWSYDPVSDTWTGLNDFSGTERSNAEAFVINNKAFVAGGLDKNDVWTYSEVTDTWLQLQNAPINIIRQNNFVFGNNAYHVQQSGAEFKIYEYNSIVDQWTFKIAGPTNLTPTAMPGGYIYDAVSDFVKYNPVSNTLTSLQMRASRRTLGCGAGIQGKQYIFGGYRIIQFIPSPETAYYNDLWEFDYAQYPD